MISHIDEPNPAALLPDGEATYLAELLTAAAAGASGLGAVLTGAGDEVDGLAAGRVDRTCRRALTRARFLLLLFITVHGACSVSA